MGPIDYTLQVQSPFNAALEGYQSGAAIRNDQQQQDDRARALAQAEAQQRAAEQQRQAQIAAQQEVSAVFQNPASTANDFARIIATNPQSREALTKAWEVKNTEQKASALSDVLQWGSAIRSGKPEIAVELMTQRADTMEAQGAPADQVQALRTQAGLVKEHPQLALGMMQSFASAHPDGEKAAKAIAAFGAEDRAAAKAPAELVKANADASKATTDAQVAADTAPAVVAEANAKATTAGVTAKYAESNALKDLETKGWNIKALQADIDYKKQSARIAAMNASIAREGNDLKRQELGLKVQAMQTELDDKVRAKVGEFESARSQIEDGYTLVRELINNPELEQATGSMAIRGAIPGTKARSIAGRIEQLQNSLASANLDKLKGAMSDKDIIFLKSMSATLDRYQDEGEFRRELKRIEDVFVRADKQLRTKSGAPTVNRASPGTPAAAAPAGGGQRTITVDW